MFNLKNLFVKEETQKKEVAPPVASTQSSTAYQMAPGIGTGSPTKMDYGKYLEEALEAANLPGPDFLEFRKTLAKHAGQPLGEKQKYELAYTAFESMGITPGKLCDASDHYINVIDKEVQGFTEEEAETNKLIEDKRQEMARLTEENLQLQQKMQENSAKSEQLNSEVYQMSISLATERRGFDASVAEKKTGIQMIVNNIKMYLNANTTQ